MRVISLAILLIICTSFKHPLYISTININHNAKDKNIEISVRAFTDDVEAAIKNIAKQNIDVSNKQQQASNDKLVANYLEQKVKISVNSQAKSLHYVGFEIQKESIWIYAEITGVASLKTLDINANWLYEFTQKQSNIISAIANGKEKNYKLDYPNTTTSFNW